MARPSRVRRAIVALAVALTAVVATGTASATATATEPDPFAGWDVREQRTNGAVQVSFDSPLLDRRTMVTVHLPAGYSPDGADWPVVYYLHGTLLFGPRQPEVDFAAQRERARFLLVELDTDPAGVWCRTCLWIDGRDDLAPVTAPTIPAESHLHDEVLPLVESLFQARTDRAGRGVLGYSMGGIGALIQATRHPDRFGFAGSISGAYDLVDEPGVRALAEIVGYLRDQGYGTGATHEPYWRGLNPADLLSNLAGQGVTVLLSAGDGCVSPTVLLEPGCIGQLPLSPPSLLELVLRHNTDLAVGALAAAGVPAEQVRVPGVHGSANDLVYERWVVPAANAAFDRPAPLAARMSYRSVDERFAAHGYDVTVTRDRAGFTELSGERDGSAFSLGGLDGLDGGLDGALVRTPPSFVPGQEYRVLVGTPERPPLERVEWADLDGRITVALDLAGTGRIDVRIVPNERE